MSKGLPKKGLGKGLGALISDSETVQNREIREVPLSDLDPNPNQPRKEFDQGKLEELAQSIREHGLLQPILIYPNGMRYYIVAGERRYRAASLAGLDRISCIVLDRCDDHSIAEKALIENIQRDDLSVVEEGRAYAHLINEYGLTQEEIAKRVGKSRSTVTNLLRVVQLPKVILDMISRDSISLGHAKVLLGLDNEESQIELAHQIIKEELSVRKTEDILKQKSSDIVQAVERKAPVIKEYNFLADIEDQMRAHFQTKVKLKGTATKGKIEIEYFSREDLERLLEAWNLAI